MNSLNIFNLLCNLIFSVAVSNLVVQSEAGTEFSSRHRIVGGSEAIPHEFPWLALIRYKSNSSRENQICSASILSKKWLLTAAHCCQSRIKSYRITAGLHNKDVVTGREQSVHLESIVLHPQYNPRTFQNDLALVKIIRRFRFTRFVKPIELIPTDFDAVVGTSTIVAGWGSQKYGISRGTSNILRKVETPIISLTTCRRQYEGLMNITEANLCTGRSGQSSCQGDSGAPVLCRAKLKDLYLCGVVQGAKGCGDAAFPQVNANVRHYLDWIKKIITT